MLARLEGLPGVERAETDFSGDHLRLTVADASAQNAAIELLAASGYLGEVVTAAPTDRWYDGGSVGELSRVEAGVIADRVLTIFRRVHSLDDAASAALRDAIVDALHRCFTHTTIAARPSPSLRASAVTAVRDAAAPIVGDGPAAELARLVEQDMSSDHKQQGGIIGL
ncbi:MAG TPA: hypothetical protein VFM06_11305 [Candidatus Limnocylindria bacterium]|nr:hypothetical protein [Candidatus Limnocylindria bacterium]